MTGRENKYHKKVEIPVSVNQRKEGVLDKAQKIISLGLSKGLLGKAIYLALVFSLVGSQVVLLSAFEASIINVTARICDLVETRTIGFWKNHYDIIINPDNELLPQFLGNHPEDIWFNGIPEVDDVLIEDIFENANAKEMADMLRAQLLAMKFNVDYFPGTGDFKHNETTIYEIIDSGDAILRQDLSIETEGLRKALEDIKNLLEFLNNEHQLTHCSGPNEGFSFFGTDENFLAQLITSVNLIEITIAPPSECKPEAQQACDTSFLGVCATGVQFCDELGFWSECMQSMIASPEVCDNKLDDDCNGVVDCDDEACAEDAVCELEPELLPEPEPEPELICGDGNLDEGEECDDGNTEDGDGCSATCVVELPPECIPEDSRICDTGSLGICAVGTQDCDEQGFWSECAQNSTSTAEVCDNGSDDDCDGFTDCDDGDCGLETVCQPEPSCGDGVIDGEEQCDIGQDNGLECVPEYGANCNYCSTECQIVELAGTYCGDANLDEGEECDDGNNINEDGCSAECLIESEPEQPNNDNATTTE